MRNLINELGNFSIYLVKYDIEMSKSEKVGSSKTYIMALIYETSYNLEIYCYIQGNL